MVAPDSEKGAKVRGLSDVLRIFLLHLAIPAADGAGVLAGTDAGRLVRLAVGPRFETMVRVLCLGVAMVLLIGGFGSTRGANDQTDAGMAQGHDKATQTENEAISLARQGHRL